MENQPTDGASGFVPDDYSTYSKKQVQDAVESANLRERIRQELQTLPQYQAYFSPYTPSSVESFISSYAFTKSLFLTYASMYQRDAERDALGYRDEAEEHLWEIQQKKLFDLQCQWRAGLIQLPDIEATDDFNHWEHNIRNCSFLEPISEEEVDLYIQFLHTDDALDIQNDSGWQHYDNITQSYQNSDNEDEINEIPEWYQFYNVHRGTTQLMTLPDLKGEKEDFYRQLFHDKRKKDAIAAGTYQEYVPQPMPPYLNSYDHDQIIDFIKTCESKKDLELYRNYHLSQEKRSNAEFAESAFELLQEANIPVAIEAHEDWREALIRAANRYKVNQIAVAMRGVHEDYLFKQQTGLGYETEDKYYTIDWINQMKNQILDGRELNGEPRNFDY